MNERDLERLVNESHHASVIGHREGLRLYAQVPTNLVALSLACHRGDHGDCRDHDFGGSHECECSCHVSR